MKPAGLSWPDYLRGYATLRWRNPDDEQRCHEVCGLLQAMYELHWSPVLNRAGPKMVFATRTPQPVQDKGHSPWTFKAQCLTTGRVSTAIPYERLIEFGILTEDTLTGGPFPKEPAEIEDRTKPIYRRLQAEAARVAPTWCEDGPSWHERYSDYLSSEPWLELRRKVLIRDRFRCRWTGKAGVPGDPLQVHHLTYARLGCEDMDDLVTVCRSAHRRHHDEFMREDVTIREWPAG